MTDEEGSVLDIILMGGLWLEAGAWNEVAAELIRLGHNPIVLRLPGVEDRSTSATLEDQVETAVAAVDAAHRPLVVGHSAASTLAWMVADRRPADISGVVMIGGFPARDGEKYAAFFDLVDGVMPFPGWQPFEGPDSDDLDDETKERIEAAAIPVPAGVSHGTVVLREPRRHDVPLHLICPEFSPDDVKAWVDAGEVPELEAAGDYSLLDIDSGHWPMYTKPEELAGMLAVIAST